jgi:hypothetical protein
MLRIAGNAIIIVFLRRARLSPAAGTIAYNQDRAASPRWGPLTQVLKETEHSVAGKFESVLKGHDFSRAVRLANRGWALALRDAFSN